MQEGSAEHNNATEHVAGTTLIPARIEVAFNNNMWWEIPEPASSQLLQLMQEGFTQASYVWDWGDTRHGSFVNEDGATSLSRYTVNFRTLMQVNSDTQRTRRIRVIHIIRGA